MTRRLLMLAGTGVETRAAALACLADIEDSEVLWVEAVQFRTVRFRTVRFRTVAPQRVGEVLGTAFDAVVLDLHQRFDPDLLGKLYGCVRGGGALLLRISPEGPPRDARLAVPPHGPGAVADRSWQRFRALLGASAAAPPGRPLSRAQRSFAGTPEQAVLVDSLAARWAGEAPTISVVLADRGRGKSSALGLAIRAFVDGGGTGVVVGATHEASVCEVQRFAEGRGTFVPISVIGQGHPHTRVLVIDEAAQIPVPVLQRVVERHAGAHLVFASTVRGYEGTGRGFVLRFLAWIHARGAPVTMHTLKTPIRFAPDGRSHTDGLERFMLEALALHARPVATVQVSLPTAAVHRIEDRDALAADERRLGEVFGLLVHAHYRTTPGDLCRLLDAPNLSVHTLVRGDHVVGAALVAAEGSLSSEQCEAIGRGGARVRGHALAETLVTHCGRPDAGMLSMVRSVRIAVHPGLRRLGLAGRLVAAVHASHAHVDLFGTLFGATADLVAFRQAAGYAVVRVGASAGSRTGVPSVVMLRAASPAAQALVHDLRRDLARALPLQLALHEADGVAVVEPALREALARGLPAVEPFSDEELERAFRSYAFGVRPYEAAAAAVTAWVGAHAPTLSGLSVVEARLVTARVLERVGWRQVAAEAGLSVPGAMRAMRLALSRLA